MKKINFIFEYIQQYNMSNEKRAFLLSDSRYKIYNAERRTGKTSLLTQDLIYNAIHEPGRYLVIYSPSGSVNHIVDSVNECLDNFGTRAIYNIVDLRPSQKLPNGSVIDFLPRGAASSYLKNNWFRGRKYNHIYIDEGDKIIFTYLTSLLLVGDISIFATLDDEAINILSAYDFELISEGVNYGTE